MLVEGTQVCASRYVLEGTQVCASRYVLEGHRYVLENCSQKCRLIWQSLVLAVACPCYALGQSLSVLLWLFVAIFFQWRASGLILPLPLLIFGKQNKHEGLVHLNTWLT